MEEKRVFVTIKVSTSDMEAVRDWLYEYVDTEDPDDHPAVENDRDAFAADVTADQPPTAGPVRVLVQGGPWVLSHQLCAR